MDKKTRFLRYWSFFYLWIGCMFIGSSIPGENLPDFKWYVADTAAHFFEYFIFGILCMRAIKSSYPRFNFRGLFVSAFLFCLFFALSDEFHQTFVSGRSWAIEDLISDAVGSFLGIFFYNNAVMGCDRN